MLVALCLNKVFCFIMPLYKIYKMYSILSKTSSMCIFNAIRQRIYSWCIVWLLCTSLETNFIYNICHIILVAFHLVALCLNKVLCFIMPLYKIYTMYSILTKTSSMCIFKAVKKQLGIGFIVDALFGYFAHLHHLHTVVELHKNFILIHFGRQPLFKTYV